MALGLEQGACWVIMDSCLVVILSHRDRASKKEVAKITIGNKGGSLGNLENVTAGLLGWDVSSRSSSDSADTWKGELV